MNKNINDFLDNITQQELEQWEQIPLITMEDSMTQKRIQKMVKRKLKKKVVVKKYIMKNKVKVSIIHIKFS